jgi:hypothetical protein
MVEKILKSICFSTKCKTFVVSSPIVHQSYEKPQMAEAIWLNCPFLSEFGLSSFEY